MEWYYLIIFILAIMVPHFIREDMFGLSHERVEEIALFILGLIGLAFFMVKRYQLKRNIAEKEKDSRRLQQTAKDLVESYSYIGEINRKMDLLMQIGIGLSNQSEINKKKENELYKSMVEAAGFLLKAECALIIFLGVAENKIKKELCFDNCCSSFDRSPEFFRMEDNIHIKQNGDFLIVSSQTMINGIRSYLVIKGGDRFQASDHNNQEILKYLASQALFLYSSIRRSCPPENKPKR